MTLPSLFEEDIFQMARRIEAGEARAAYLDQVCVEDAALRERVDALLSAYDESQSFLESPASAMAGGVTGSTTPDETPLDKPGTQIGPYKLLQQIGEGGMGLVYLAEQQRPVRRMVALKIIRPGMDSKQVIARFEAERQALAMMDHVNIAKVLDAGTTDADRPYFVMELVKGVPITRYCDERRLTLQDRLDLFVQVCQAIGHAHQKGVIHRDIKPSNVLIALYDEAPVPKVIDFGVAKATAQKLTEKTTFTGVGQLIGTLDYMSPEQAQFNQLDIDTRSDIYSLGVLLYELLTGSTPFEQARLRTVAFDETLRIIREEEPPKPSTRLSAADTLTTIADNRNLEPARLRKAVRGELDWIVMKCLEKDRNRRYQSACDVVSDIGRYLHDDPVHAGPPSPVYRLKKYLSRNKGGLAVAAGMLLAVAAIAATVGWALRDRAARESEIKRAQIDQWAIVERQVRDTLSTARTLIADNKVASARERLAQARAILAGGGSALGTLAAEVEADQVELTQFQQLLDLVDRAHQSVAAPVYEPDLSDDDFGDGEDAEPPAPARIVQHRPAAAVPFLLDALDRYDVVARDGDHSRREVRMLSARQIGQSRRVAYEALLWLADDSILRKQDHRSQAELSAQSAAQQALNYLSKAVAIDQSTNALYVLRAKCHKALQDDTSAQSDVQAAAQTPPTIAFDHFLRGMAALNDDQPAEGASAFEAALRLEPTHYWSLLKLADCLAHSSQKPEQWVEAVRVYTGCILNRPDHAYANYRRGGRYYDLRRYQEALADYSQAIELDPTVMRAWYRRGLVHNRLKMPDKALADFTRTIALDPNYAYGWRARGSTYNRLGQPEKALADYSQAIAIEPDYAYGWRARASTYEKLGQSDNALVDLSKAIELQPTSVYAWNTRGVTYYRLQQPAKALADYSKAIELDPENWYAWCGRGMCYNSLNEPKKALAEFARSLELNPQDAYAWNCRGTAHRRLGQREEALAAWTKAVELNPKLTAAWTSRGILYINLGQPDNALADFSQAIELSPKSAVYWSNRAKLRHRVLDQPENAIADYLKAIEVEPNQPAGHNDLAWLLATYPNPKVRDPGRAVELAEKAVELAPKSTFYWNTLGAAHYRAGNWQAAVSALVKSIELKQAGDAYDHFFLAMCHSKLGQHDAARAAYQQGAESLEKNKARLQNDSEYADEIRRFQKEAEEVLAQSPGVTTDPTESGG